MLSAELLEILRDGVIATVFQIRPDDIFLREAEHAKSSSPHGCVNGHTRVGHQLSSLIKASPDVSNLWAVLQVPTVGHLVLPANISWILPQQTHLVGGVSGVPQ